VPTNVLSVNYTDEQGQVSENFSPILKQHKNNKYKEMDMVFFSSLLRLIVLCSFMHLLNTGASID
jgi:hypothetical protein